MIEKALAVVNLGDYGFIQPVNSTVGIGTLVYNIIQTIVWIAGIAAIIYLIYSGILYITAAGNPDAAKKGQQGIINAVIGIVIIVLAWVIARAIGSFASIGIGT